MKLVLATRNADKLREIKTILGVLPVKLLSLEDFPGCPVVVEDGSSFEENAVKKALSVWTHTGEASLAEDSGLETDHLKGAPGILSARFAGGSSSSEQNNMKLLSLLEGVPAERRSAVFVCVAALILQSGRREIFKGTLRGFISERPRGDSGFGYDPVFIVPEYGKTVAELGEEIKNRISHRAVAMGKVREYLAGLLGHVR